MNQSKVSVIVSVIICLLLTSAALAKAISANDNLAAGKSAYGSFSNPGVAVDGKLVGLPATSGNVTDDPQYLTIDIGTNMYLDRVRIYWDKNAYSNDFTVRTSANAKIWQTEAQNLDASLGALDTASNTIATTISLKRAMISSRYVQIMVPAGTKVTNPSGNAVKILEVQVFPAVDQKFTIDNISVYGATDTTCLLKYKTSIGVASGSAIYGTEPGKLNMAAGNSEKGTDNSLVFVGLKPKTTYYYQISAVDYYGNKVTSRVNSFATAGDDIALNKKVTGTFTNYPIDPYVKAASEDVILSRITDGKTSYFTSMAQSGVISDADQYAVIDLGRSYKIKNILTYWRQLAYPEALTVQVSENNSAWSTLASAADVGSGAWARSDAGDPMKVHNVAGASGRYIKILVPKGSPFYHKHDNWNFVELMEVKAFE